MLERGHGGGNARALTSRRAARHLEYAMTSPRAAPNHVPTPLREIALLFLKLGTTAFGGPAAHIAMMEDEVVRRRGWLTRAEFLDYLGATNLIPGPNSTELAIHIGHARAGWLGLLVAGACFILPASLIVLALAWGYVRYGALPATAGVLLGVKPVVIAIVLQALWRLARTAITTVPLGVLAAISALAAARGIGEITILAAAGLVMALFRARAPRDAARVLAAATVQGGGGRDSLRLPSTAGAIATGAAAAYAGTPVALWPLFASFAKIGAVLFGSGYVLLAFLRADFVERLGWLSERQLLDAVAVGQVTPGPVSTAATFIGYVLAGGAGAAVATLGIFLPAFAFVAASGPIVPRLRRSPTAGAVLDGVNAASLALMAVVTWQLARAAVVDAWTLALAAASSLLLFRWRVGSTWLVLGGALAGLLLELARRA
jgi:chromate transporter